MLSKQTAIKLMLKGHKLTHKGFTPNEWMSMDGQVSYKGRLISKHEFLNIINCPDGWEVVEQTSSKA